MLLRWLEKSRLPIGLDIGGRMIRALQLARRGDGYRVMAAAGALLPADIPAAGKDRDKVIEQTLRQVLDQGEFFGKQVVSCLPAHLVQYKNLRLPRMPREELTAAVEWEARDRLQLGNDQAVVQFFDAGEVRQGDEIRQEVILMAAPLSLIEEHAQLLMRCGLQPVAIDAAPAAMARALENQGETAGAGGGGNIGMDTPAQFILDVGHTSAKAVVARYGHVMFFKIIDLGGSKLDQVVAGKLGIPLSEAIELRRRLMRQGAAGEGEQPLFGSSRRESIDRAVFEALRPLYSELATEVGLCLRYYSVTFRGRRPECVQLTGGEAGDPILAKALEEELKISAIPAQPLLHTDLAEQNLLREEELGHPAGWTAAVGLSMRGNAIRVATRGAA